MGSASREALAEVRTTLRSGQSETTGPELLQAADQIGANVSLAAALGDATAEATDKTQLVSRLFGGLSDDARAVLTAASAARWSNPDEFVEGVEELGIRAAALSDSALADELLAVADLVDRDHELELSLGSKLIATEGKLSLVNTLLASHVSAVALAVVRQLVANPRGRRLDAALRRSAQVASDQGGSELATVTVAQPLNAQQQERLTSALERSVGRPVKVTTIVDPELLGGIRVQIADDVIDGSVRARLDDLRQQLAA